MQQMSRPRSTTPLTRFELPFARFFLKSTIHVLGVIAGCFFLVTMAAYAFAQRLKCYVVRY